MFAAVSEYILLTLNFFEIIINLIYLGLYFANISFGVVLNSSSTNNGNNNNSDNGHRLNDDDHLKYHNRSSAWLTIMDDKLSANLKDLQTNNIAGDHNNKIKNNNSGQSAKTTKFALDQVDNSQTGNATTLANRKQHDNNNEIKKPFYKTLPKTFGRRDEKYNKPTSNTANSGIMRNGSSLRGSQESLKSSGQTGGGGSSSSSSTSSLHNIPPNRPPPPPPSNRRSSGISPTTTATTSCLATNGGAPSREQMFISLLSSVFGFFVAKFRLTWLLLFYSIYIVTGVVMWLYNHAFIYRRVRHLNHSEQSNYMRRSSAPTTAGLVVSAPTQSLGLSSALDLTNVCDNMYDEVHLQMLASRRDVVDMGLKLLLTMSAYDLSKSF